MKFCQFLGYMIIAITIPQNVFAAPDMQIDFVKKLYETGRNLGKGTEVVEMYADKSLQRAFNVAAESGESCFGADPMWQSQDPEYQKKLAFSKAGKNQVKVNMAKKNYDQASWVIYKLNCQNNVCKISDLIDQEGSLKQSIYEVCS